MENNQKPLTETDLQIGGRYNWKNQAERLVYVGMCEPRNGRWHQFEKIDKPGEVWCEVHPTDISKIEVSKQEPMVTLGELKIIDIVIAIKAREDGKYFEVVSNDAHEKKHRTIHRVKYAGNQLEEARSAFNCSVEEACVFIFSADLQEHFETLVNKPAGD